jgi:hypothetical protein
MGIAIDWKTYPAEGKGMSPTLQRMRWRAVVLLSCLACALGSVADAQQEQRQAAQLGTSQSANFRFAEPGELTITVSVLGAVRTPGRYEISRRINLLDLLALAGGFLDYADRGDVAVTRYVSPGLSDARENFYFDMYDLTMISDKDLRLEQADIIYVPGSPDNSFDDLLRYLTTLAVLVTAGIAISANF